MVLVASIANAKGGSGKSTTSINLGVELSRLGKEVTVVDGNLSNPCLGSYLGAPHVDITLHHVLNGSANLNEALYEHVSGMKIVPGSLKHHDSFKNLSMAEFKHQISKLDSDIVLIDSAPGMDEEAIKLSDEVLIVTPPELPSVTHSLRTVKLAERLGKNISGILLTRAGHETDMSVENIEAMLGHKVIGIIPEDGMVKHATSKREPVTSVYPHAPSSIAYHNLAAMLLGKESHNLEGEHSEIGNTSKVLKWALGVK